MKKQRPTSGQKKSPSSAGAPRCASAGTKRPSAALLAAKQRAQQQKKATVEPLQDPYQQAEDAKTMIRGQTAMVTDPRMAEHYCLWDSSYPECPERLTQTVERCRELGLLERCLQLESCPAAASDLLAVHSEELIEKLKGTSGCTDEEKLEALSSQYDAVYIHPTSYELALLAAGSAISLVETVCTGRAQNGIALIRPPGHHAMQSEFCGYCFFNNAAVASRRALEEGWAQKILIVDWDVHHGQASQQAFYDDDRVLYFSIHRYENGQFWPNLEESNYHYIGVGKGAGYNINVPLNAIGMGDAEYLAIFNSILLPVAHQFQPDLVIVSAGYDAAVGCPEFTPDLVLVSAGFDSALGDEKGEMVVTPACYGHFINLLSVLANGKVAVLLEGGYCLRSLAESAAMTLKSLLGDPCSTLGNLLPPCDTIRDTILDVTYALRPFWDALKMQQPAFSDKDEKLDLHHHSPKVNFLGPAVPAAPPFATRDCYPLQSQEFKDRVNAQLSALISGYHLPGPPSLSVGLIYDDGMLSHINEKEPTHVESPRRTMGIFSKHEEFGLLERCLRLPRREANEEELLMVHSPKHVEDMRDTSGKSSGMLEELAESFSSIYLHPSTFSCAQLATGCVLEALDSIMMDKCRSAVAIVRPPGHHAERSEPCGFCIFNNVAVAAEYALKKYGLKRILLLDWDVHHGNGTQSIFESDPRVLYISLHRYDNGRFFPASMSSQAAFEASAEFVGKGEGKGFSINIPWNKSGMGDSEYVAAFLQLVLPVVYQYNPELVLISAGFDAAIRDPLGGCRVSPEMYGQLTRWLQGLAGGRVVVALEGGYNVDSISYSLTMCTKALLGDPLPQVRASAPCQSGINSIRNAQLALAPYWSCLRLHTCAIPAKQGLVYSRSSLQLKTDLVDRLADQLSNVTLEQSPSPTSPEEKFVDDASDDQVVPSSLSFNHSPEEVSTPSEPVKEADTPEQAGSSGQAPTAKKTPDQASASGGSDTPAVKTLKDFLEECAKSGEEMHLVSVRSDCPHLDQVQPLGEDGVDLTSTCEACSNEQENWICLTCYQILCGRYANQHMKFHSQEYNHPLVFSQSDHSVWCYACEDYVDAPILYEVKNSAHLKKFGSKMPWTYGDTPSFELQ